MKLEIGHVLFIDIVGYSKLLITEQSEQLQKLKEIVRETEQFRMAEAEGRLLRLPTGDGGALVFRNNPEAPVLCAMEISKALKKHPELRVRMGIHSGPVNTIRGGSHICTSWGKSKSSTVCVSGLLISTTVKSGIRKIRRSFKFSTSNARANWFARLVPCAVIGWVLNKTVPSFVSPIV
jgi:hypothetical protein